MTTGRVAAAIALTVVIGTSLAGIWLLVEHPIELVTFIISASVGTYLIARRPRNVIGWLLILSGWAFTGGNVGPVVDPDRLIDGSASGIDFLRTWINGLTGTLTYVTYAAIGFVFPTGRLPEGRWGRIAAVTLGAALFVSVIPAFMVPALSMSPDGVTEILVPNRLALLPIEDPAAASFVASYAILVPIAAVALAAIDLVRRYRASSGLVHLQIRWLMAALAFMLVAVVFGLAMFAVFGEGIGIAAWLPALVAFQTVPIAIGVAVSRYRLFEIDRVVSRTIGWAVITGGLLVVFGTLVLALQTLFDDVTQGDTLPVAISTLVAAALFQPIRRRVQHAVDRRFDRARYDGERTTAAFAERLRSEVDLDAVAADLSGAVQDALHPQRLGLWLKGSGR
jgi:hypothetical protein